MLFRSLNRYVTAKHRKDTRVRLRKRVKVGDRIVRMEYGRGRSENLEEMEDLADEYELDWDWFYYH